MFLIFFYNIVTKNLSPVPLFLSIPRTEQVFKISVRIYIVIICINLEFEKYICIQLFILFNFYSI